jgi:protein-L-isoaspartate O-methyltransferase
LLGRVLLAACAADGASTAQRMHDTRALVEGDVIAFCMRWVRIKVASQLAIDWDGSCSVRLGCGTGFATAVMALGGAIPACEIIGCLLTAVVPLCGMTTFCI